MGNSAEAASALQSIPRAYAGSEDVIFTFQLTRKDFIYKHVDWKHVLITFMSHLEPFAVRSSQNIALLMRATRRYV